MRYTSVTVWHKKGQEYKRILFERAMVSKAQTIKGYAAEQTESNNISIRAYTICDCGIFAGDRLCMGYDEAIYPPEDAYVITEVKGFFNAGAGLRHYRFKCE